MKRLTKLETLTNDINIKEVMRSIERYVSVITNEKISIRLIDAAAMGERRRTGIYRLIMSYTPKPTLELDRSTYKAKRYAKRSAAANLDVSLFDAGCAHLLAEAVKGVVDTLVNPPAMKEGKKAEMTEPDKRVFIAYACSSCGGQLTVGPDGNMTCQHCGTVYYQR